MMMTCDCKTFWGQLCLHTEPTDLVRTEPCGTPVDTDSYLPR